MDLWDDHQMSLSSGVWKKHDCLPPDEWFEGRARRAGCYVCIHYTVHILYCTHTILYTYTHTLYTIHIFVAITIYNGGVVDRFTIIILV